MILSNNEIHKAIDEGKLVINPEPLPRIRTVNEDCPYDTHTVNLKLHNEILFLESGTFNINLTNPGSLADFITKHSEKYTLKPKQPFPLKRGDFILGRTVEWIGLPVKNGPPYLAARIEGKSSRARCGLLIHCTAPIVHPGFKGTLTLEMINLGPAPISLYPGMYIAQLIVEQVDGEINLNPSQFQGQKNPAGTT